MGENTYEFRKKELDKGDDTISCCYSLENSFVVAEITEKLAQQLSAQMLEEKEEMWFPYSRYLKEMSCHFLLMIWNGDEEEKLYFFSDSKRIRAVEYLDYLIAEFGLVKGNSFMAAGKISRAILKVQMSEVDILEPLEFFLYQSQSYFTQCDCIDAARYGVEHRDEIAGMKKYEKKKIPWAYVKSMDILEKGEKLHIKSLENECGLELEVSEDVYLMIGCRGEMYDIKKEKFEKTYEATDMVLDIFEQMLDFLPEVQEVKTGKYLSVDQKAHLCYPKAGMGVYAKKLTKRTKIFPKDSEQEYYLGRPGDYMAIRPDDFCDIYVIEGEIFRQTYE